MILCWTSNNKTSEWLGPPSPLWLKRQSMDGREQLCGSSQSCHCFLELSFLWHRLTQEAVKLLSIDSAKSPFPDSNVSATTFEFPPTSLLLQFEVQRHSGGTLSLSWTERVPDASAVPPPACYNLGTRFSCLDLGFSLKGFLKFLPDLKLWVSEGESTGQQLLRGKICQLALWISP